MKKKDCRDAWMMYNSWAGDFHGEVSKRRYNQVIRECACFKQKPFLNLRIISVQCFPHLPHLPSLSLSLSIYFPSSISYVMHRKLSCNPKYSDVNTQLIPYPTLPLPALKPKRITAHEPDKYMK